MVSKKIVVSGIAVAAGIGLGAGLFWGVAAPANTTTGTESFVGTVPMTAAQAANPNFNPTVPITASGLFSDHGSIYLAPGSGPGGNGPGSAVIKFASGNINVNHTKSTNPQPKFVSACTFTLVDRVGYTVTGGSGSYSGIKSGGGTAVVTFNFDVPAIAHAHNLGLTGPGACNTNAAPTSGEVIFKAVGPITRS
jgi:hypothetical protein